MAQFGKSRSRKDVHDSYLVRGGSDISDPGEIGNVNSLSDFESGKAGNFNSPAPPSPSNLQFAKNKYFLKDYFTDLQTHHFKNGLEVASTEGNISNENLHEDPIIFGFDFIINHITSPLFDRTKKQIKNNLGDGTIDDFFRFAETNGISEITNRVGIYNDFLNQFELLFLTTRGGSFDSFKSHYLVGVEGLGDLINKSTGLGSTKQFADFGKDKITLTLKEDVHLSGGYLTSLYNTLSYSKIRGKQVIPDNLLRFDGSIVISEIRNYKKIKKLINYPDGEPTRELISLVNDSVSRYVYNIYDCQFVFDSHSHPSSIKNTSKEIAEDFNINFFYKFSSLEVEKFQFDSDGNSISKYFNDGNPIDPKKKYIGESVPGGDANENAVRRNEFINRGYQEGTDPYTIYDTPTSNNIEAEFSVSNGNTDGINSLRASSLQESIKAQKEARLIKNEETKSNIELDSLTKNSENSISGYTELIKDSDPAETFGEGGGLKGIIDRTKSQALKNLRFKRDQLINDTLQSIRTATGLRRIGSPINVYDDNVSIFGTLKNELRDFTNTGFSAGVDGIDDIF